ncbi:MAG: thioredoxin [Firmicutes bacterium]|jgi:thioredoxin 1|nr:thioredoxin [Bacillota bacterium]MDY5585869.1 thioredoxin [Eubacteriales bacterium]
MKIVQKDEFEKIINESKPTIVDFFATWCGPCKMLSPILEKVEEDSKGEFNIVKIDVDESYDVAKKYGIMSVPTMIIFKDGDEQEKIVGLRQKNQIEDAVRNYID